MNPVWLVPVLALLVGGAATVALLRGAAEEAKLLVDELAREREVARSFTRLAAELRSTDDALRRVRSRREARR